MFLCVIFCCEASWANCCSVCWLVLAVGQCCHLSGNRGHRVLAGILVVQHAKSILVGQCGSVPVVASGGPCCIQAPLKGLLDHGAKHNPCLVYQREAIPFLKCLGERPVMRSRRITLVIIWQSVYGFFPRRAVSAHSLIHQKRISGVSATK
jgi:hypothetical protein